MDNAIPNRLGFRFSGNRGQLLENAIFVELLRRGKRVYYFSGKLECDFLVKEGLHITEAIQVTHELNAMNLEREIGGLTEAMQRFDIPRGTLILLDDHFSPEVLPPGVTLVPAYKWLLGG